MFYQEEPLGHAGQITLLCLAWFCLGVALEELLEVAREKDVPALTVVRATWNPISVGMDDWTDACDSMY